MPSYREDVDAVASRPEQSRTRGAAEPKCSVPFAPGETTRRPGDRRPLSLACAWAMATPRRAVRAMGESAREVSRKPLRETEELPSRSSSSESGESGDAGALVAPSAPASRKPLSPSRPAGVGPRARPSRSDGDAGGTGSVVSKAMKSPSPLSEFRFSCAKRFSPLACFPAPAPVSSALGLRRTTKGTRAALGAGGETRGRGLGCQDHARVAGSTGSRVRGVLGPRRVRARASEGTSGAEG
jgi:hypothetical protein